jgi:hypothetical protein
MAKAKRSLQAEQLQQQQQQQEVQAEQLQQQQEVQVEHPHFDFSRDVFYLSEQLQYFKPHRQMHVIRQYAKFKKLRLDRYEVECHLGKGFPSLLINYFYDGNSYNYVLCYRDGRTVSKDFVIMDTRTQIIPEKVATMVYNATLALIEYLQSDGSFRILVELRRKGYVVRRRINRYDDPNAPSFSDFLKLFQ